MPALRKKKKNLHAKKNRVAPVETWEERASSAYLADRISDLEAERSTCEVLVYTLRREIKHLQAQAAIQQVDSNRLFEVEQQLKDKEAELQFANAEIIALAEDLEDTIAQENYVVVRLASMWKQAAEENAKLVEQLIWARTRIDGHKMTIDFLKGEVASLKSQSCKGQSTKKTWRDRYDAFVART